MKYKKTLGSLVFCCASSILASHAFAGAADMATPDGNHMKFEYEGNKLRINTDQQGTYMVINSDGMYAITNSAGQIVVIDAGKMMGMFAGMASTAPSVASSEILSLKATGRQESRAGITGEIYNLKYIDKDSGNAQTTELVLSGDSRAIEMTKAISRMAAAMVKATGQNQRGANELQTYMTDLNKGVLRYGDDMWVTAISTRTIANDRFVLPAAPQNLSGMSGLADAIKAQSAQTTATSDPEQQQEATQKNGLVSGLLSVFGNKADKQADRQQDRAESKADDAVDKATDNAVDKALDKVFGKLFGN